VSATRHCFRGPNEERNDRFPLEAGRRGGSRGKQPVYDRVAGADHSFAFADHARPHGWPERYGRIVAWFLEGSTAQK